MSKWGTKHLPKEKGRYLVTFKDEYGNHVGIADRYKDFEGEWRWRSKTGGDVRDIIAWQKLKEPYQPEG